MKTTFGTLQRRRLAFGLNLTPQIRQRKIGRLEIPKVRKKFKVEGFCL